jgi:mono/diheme cytochrome c family protein
MKLFGTFALIAFGAGSSWAGSVEGKALFDKSCKSCHGSDGKGNPMIAKMMKVDLKPVGAASDSEIKASVVNGKGKMKPVASVAGKQLDDLIAYAKTLK